MSLTRRFFEDRAGNVSTTFAFALVPMIAFAGAAVDYSRATDTRSSIQAAVDASALGAVNARLPFESQRLALGRSLFNGGNATGLPASVSVIGDSRSITVTASTSVKAAILSAVGFDEIGLTTTATAVKVFQGPPPCVLALNRSVLGGVTITGSSSFAADGCVVHSNSSHASGMVLDGSSLPRAAGFCSVGGVSTTRAIKPEPQSYCEVMADPFASVAPPSSGGCTYNQIVVSPNQTKTLSPGAYCGGLELKGKVTLQPGVYVIKNGPLIITSQAEVSGTGVTFYLTGSNAGFTIDGSSSLNVGAPSNGPYGGILLFQDRLANAGYENRLAGGSMTKIVGAIYAPTQKVTVTGSSGFGQQTPFMPIIADQIRISGSISAKADLTGVTPGKPLPKSQSGARLTR
jgi:hypothetical protein